MDASGQFQALVPLPLDAEGIERRRELEDIHEELLLSVLDLEFRSEIETLAAALPAGPAPTTITS